MDLSALLTAGEWMDVPGLEGLDELGSFRLKIAPVDPLMFGLSLRDHETIGKIFDLVIGWDLMDGDKPAEFTAENKVHLRPLLIRRVKDAETGEFGEPLLHEIMRFSAGPNARSKNLQPISTGMPNGAVEQNPAR